jgi:hypothetical protein
MSNIITYPTGEDRYVGREFVVGATTKVWDGSKWVNKSFGNHETRLQGLEEYIDGQQFANIDAVKVYPNLSELLGQRVHTKEYHSGTGYGGATYEVVSSASVTPNDIDIIQSTSKPLVSLKLAEFSSGLSIDKLGAKKSDASFDNAVIIDRAYTYLSSNGGGEFKGVGKYYTTNIHPKDGVVFTGPRSNALSIRAVESFTTGLMTLVVMTGVSGNFAEFDSTVNEAGLENCLIDCDLQDSGNAVAFTDNGTPSRNDNYLRNVCIYRAPDRGIYIDPHHDEGLLDSVFVRGGLLRNSRRTQVGIENKGTDWKVKNTFVGFCVNNGVLESGGASRYTNVDVWGCGGYNVKITGTSGYWYRLQSDSGDSGALLIDSAKTQNFITFTCIENQQVSTVADVLVTGDCRDIQFVSPSMRGSSFGNTFAFEDDTGGNVVEVIGGSYASAYTTSFSNNCEAWWQITGGTGAKSEIRAGRPKAIINTNPLFNNFSGGAPSDWSLRSSATATQLTAGLPTGYASGVDITSSATATSGLQKVLDPAIYAGRKVRVSGWIRGTGATFNGNQRVSIFTSSGSTEHTVENDNTWRWFSIVREVGLAEANLQVRLMATIDATAGLSLKATGVNIEVF